MNIDRIIGVTRSGELTVGPSCDKDQLQLDGVVHRRRRGPLGHREPRECSNATQTRGTNGEDRTAEDERDTEDATGTGARFHRTPARVAPPRGRQLKPGRPSGALRPCPRHTEPPGRAARPSANPVTPSPTGARPDGPLSAHQATSATRHADHPEEPSRVNSPPGMGHEPAGRTGSPRSADRAGRPASPGRDHVVTVRHLAGDVAQATANGMGWDLGSAFRPSRRGHTDRELVTFRR